MKIRVKKVNAFADSVDGGNPAGVVLDSPILSDEQMKQVTKELSVSETAFVFPSKRADYKVIFFTPKVEVDLCGHATIATFFTMALQGMFSQDCVVTQETKAGVLPISIMFSSDKRVDRVMMTQGKPVFKDVKLDFSEISKVLNISPTDVDVSLPAQRVSTGLFTLPLCIKSLDILKNISPDFEGVKELCNKLGVGSFHLYTFETFEPGSTYHARNFCPLYGINEDPVTGTANGAVCSYLFKNRVVKDKKMVCEQGDVIGRPGRVFVEVDAGTVRVGGRARIVEEKEIEV